MRRGLLIIQCLLLGGVVAWVGSEILTRRAPALLTDAPTPIDAPSAPPRPPAERAAPIAPTQSPFPPGYTSEMSRHVAPAITVRVTGADGAPAAAAIVRWGLAGTDRSSWTQTVADADGVAVVSLSDERAQIEAVTGTGRSLALGRSHTTWSHQDVRDRRMSSISVSMGPVVIVSGRCTDPSGTPVAGALVALDPTENRAVVTREDGTFEFPPVPAKSLRGFAAAWRPSRETVFGEFAPPESGTVFLQFELPWCVDVRGRVVTEQGEAVRGWTATRGGTADPEDPAVVVWRDVTSPGRAFVSDRRRDESERAGGDADGLREAEVAWTGSGPELDLGAVVVVSPKSVRVIARWSDGAPLQPGQAFRRRPGEDRLERLPVDASTGAIEFRAGSGGGTLEIRADRTPAEELRFPDGFRTTATKRVQIDGEVPEPIVLEPDPVLVLHAEDSYGTAIGFDGAEVKIVFVGEMDAEVRALVSGGIAMCPLRGPPPWHATVRVSGYAPVNLDLRDVQPRVDRRIVLREW